MTSETRTVMVGRQLVPGGFGVGYDGTSSQTAIPWCTIHNVSDVVGNMCSLRQLGVDCVISRGGPDHKWWRDTALNNEARRSSRSV